MSSYFTLQKYHVRSQYYCKATEQTVYCLISHTGDTYKWIPQEAIVDKQKNGDYFDYRIKIGWNP